MARTAGKCRRKRAPIRTTELRIDGSLTVILAIFPFGWQMLGFPNAPMLGIVSWATCLALAARVVWLACDKRMRAKWRIVSAISIPCAAFALVVQWHPVQRLISPPVARAPCALYLGRARRILLLNNNIVGGVDFAQAEDVTVWQNHIEPKISTDTRGLTMRP